MQKLMWLLAMMAAAAAALTCLALRKKGKAGAMVETFIQK